MFEIKLYVDKNWLKESLNYSNYPKYWYLFEETFLNQKDPIC